jgi:hypothetical protein
MKNRCTFQCLFLIPVFVLTFITQYDSFNHLISKFHVTASNVGIITE